MGVKIVIAIDISKFEPRHTHPKTKPTRKQTNKQTKKSIVFKTNNEYKI